MATEVLQSLDLLNQFLGQERVRLEAENKQTRIDQTIANAATALGRMPANASQADILNNQFLRIKDAATNEASAAIPMITSLYGAKSATAAYVKKEQDASTLANYLGGLMGIDLPPGTDPAVYSTLLSTKMSLIDKQEYTNSEGQVAVKMSQFNYNDPSKNKPLGEIMINKTTDEQRTTAAMASIQAKNPTEWKPTGMVDNQGRDIVRDDRGQRGVYNNKGGLDPLGGAVTYNKGDWNKMHNMSSAERKQGEDSARRDANASALALHNKLTNLELNSISSSDISTNWVEQKTDKKYQSILASIPNEAKLEEVLKEIDDPIESESFAALWYEMKDAVTRKDQYASLLDDKLPPPSGGIDYADVDKDISSALSGAGSLELQEAIKKLIQIRVPGAPEDAADINEAYFDTLNPETQNAIKREIMSAYE